MIEKSHALVCSLADIACSRVLFISLLKYHDHLSKMKQNHVCVICEKLYTTVRNLELHVAFCQVQHRKFNKKVFKRMIKNLALLMMKMSRKKTETTHESNDYILKKEKIWVDVSFESGKNKYFETQIAETMINNLNKKLNNFSWDSNIFSFFSSINVRSYINIMKKKTKKSLDHISRQRRFITDSAMNSFMKKKNTFNWLYYFFASAINYTLAHWFLHSRCTQEFINCFFQDNRFKKIHDLLSFKNAKQLYWLINNISRDIFDDKWLWYSFEITFEVINVSAKKYYVEYCNVMLIIQFLIDHSSFADKLTYTSIQQYNINES